MSAQVLLASCAELPESNGDDTALPDALAAVGIRAEWAPWDDASAGFAAADLVVLRSTWDYAHRREEFLDWCSGIPALVNPADVVRWNTHKGYLADLAGAGVPVVPTSLVEVGRQPSWPDREFVLKPAVGAGARGAARFAPDALDAARAHLDHLHAAGDAVLQPYQADVDRSGETALVFLGGSYSHAFAKAPMLAPPVPGFRTGEHLRPAEPDAALRRAAEDALDAVAGLRGIDRAELLYARVDLVRGADGAPLLLELELSEPSLGFRQTGPAAQLRFASAVRAALARR
ncbi:hypothetical protein IQ251_03350 [Saccharopolyspora sp. HNM0983]|uniref:ATP-grasp domain-containing protein n=1 Tax=Saccharopolyspora montiporae TaxID=2781240 RepID=A0A929G0C7_9PSEU|nr:hypothetical protein [Saccharopolyspora sp. HNM0983]MBE9373478.1 hypothetical protein [Saccharopolyspora sp. HNM0983]